MTSRPTRSEYVRDSLLAELRSGRYSVGDKIPNEEELGRQYDVSRATIREAVQGLAEIGYLSRKQGLGTFVTAMPRHRHTLDTTVSYTEMIRGAGMVPGESMIARDERTATDDEVERLGLSPGSEIVAIRRVRTADGTPAVYSEDRIPREMLRGLEHAPMDASLYSLLAMAGLAIHHAVASLRPVIADAKLARLLGVARGSALQYLEQVDYTEQGAAAILSSEWHVPGIFELSINRRPVEVRTPWPSPPLSLPLSPGA